jgi:DNA-binding transcriptional LysR family regulator
VGRAARKIGLSQPAASHALRRLRGLFNDPLLVRIGTRMELTPRALVLRESLAEALDKVRSVFVAERFDPRTSSRQFSLMMPDHVVDLIVPPLVERVSAEAAGVRLDIVPWRSPAAIMPQRLRSLDLAIACTADGFPGFERRRLFVDTEVVAVRRGHSLASRLKDLRAFLNARHVAVVGRGRTDDPVDVWLLGEGVKRRIALVVPSYLQALHVVARTDLVAFVPRRLVEALSAPLSLAIVRPPIDPGQYEEFLFYPCRSRQDPASIWLRELVMEIGECLESNAGSFRAQRASR